MRKSIMILLMTLLTLSISHHGVTTYASLNVLRSDGVPEYDAASLEADLKALYQSKIDAMAQDEFTFEFTGTDALKLFLVLDGSGNIAYPAAFDGEKKSHIDWFFETLHDMEPGNHNAYARFALGSSNSLQSVLEGYIKDNKIYITIRMTINWSDASIPGMTAIQARNAVVSHAQAFLDSPLYPSEGSHDERLKSINNHICETFQYDYRLFTEDEYVDVIYTAYRMISDSGALGGYPRGVCQAYAMYGYIMLKLAGYDSITINGQAGDPQGPHEIGREHV